MTKHIRALLNDERITIERMQTEAQEVLLRAREAECEADKVLAKSERALFQKERDVHDAD